MSESIENYLLGRGMERVDLEDPESFADHLDAAKNNGGDTDYYQFKKGWKDAMDIVEDREMNYAQGNIFKVAITFNMGRHDGTDYERELNKIIFFAEREKSRIKNGGQGE